MLRRMITKDCELDESQVALEVESDRLASIRRTIDDKKKELALKLKDPNADFQGIFEEMEKLVITKLRWERDVAKFEKAVEAELVKIHEESLVELQQKAGEIMDSLCEQLADLEVNILKRNDGRTV